MTDGVRSEIAVSWDRAVSRGLRPDHVEAPYDVDVDLGGRFARAAAPVADQLSDDLAGTGVALLLADERARLIDRRVSDPEFLARLDRHMLAPGFSHSEEHVGTNAIGTSLQQAGPIAVTGGEHFAADLGFLVCTAAPVTDPRTGLAVGAVGLTTASDTPNPLMLPFVKRASREIEQRLLDTPAPGTALMAQFVLARRRAKGPLVAVSERAMHTNAAAARLLQPADHAVLWAWASLALASSAPAGAELQLASGQPVTARARAVQDGGALIGALVRFTPAGPESGTRPAPAPAAMGQAAAGQGSAGRPDYGWDSLTDTERRVAGIIASGATNREAAAQLYLSRHTIDFHLRQVFRKLGIGSRVELAAIAVRQHEPGL
jgi:transcriptional regulator of acetoin/glycerol metabolism/DNA-binding CsgD family transcriptional regulator